MEQLTPRLFTIWMLDLFNILHDCVESLDYWERVSRRDHSTRMFNSLSIGLHIKFTNQFVLVTQLAKVYSQGSDQEHSLPKLLSAIHREIEDPWFERLLDEPTFGSSRKWSTADDVREYIRVSKQQIKKHRRLISEIEDTRNNFTAHTFATHGKRKRVPEAPGFHVRELRALTNLALRIHATIWREIGGPPNPLTSDVHRLDSLIKEYHDGLG